MSSPKVGDKFPEGVTFTYIPYTPEIGDFKVCGLPTVYNASKEWADKKVVIFALPGAFTPSCSASHLPGFIAALPELKAKGVDIVATIAVNDAFVMSAWGKANNVVDDSILFLSDDELNFSKQFGWVDGKRTGRYAMVIDHGIIKYAARELKNPDHTVTVSSAESVLAAL